MSQHFGGKGEVDLVSGQPGKNRRLPLFSLILPTMGLMKISETYDVIPKVSLVSDVVILSFCYSGSYSMDKTKCHYIISRSPRRL